jgi:polysaccharide biosynthesis protein PelF
MGLPVVSFAVPAVAEALGDTGMVVPMRDERALADAVDALLSDEARRADLARRTSERFDECFTEEACLEGMGRWYESTARQAADGFRRLGRK